MVPLRHKVHSGDIVEIITQPGHKPSRDWLGVVRSSRARNKIKHFIHAEEKERSLELGRKLFDKEARRYGLNLKQLTEPESMGRVLTEYGMGKADDIEKERKLIGREKARADSSQFDPYPACVK